jgi:stress-induced morphogen
VGVDAPAAVESVIPEGDLRGLIRRKLPDAQVEIVDRTGTMDHYDVLIRSKAFAGVPLLDRHRLVERAVSEARADGRLHALAIRTEVLE